MSCAHPTHSPFRYGLLYVQSDARQRGIGELAEQFVVVHPQHGHVLGDLQLRGPARFENLSASIVITGQDARRFGKLLEPLSEKSSRELTDPGMCVALAKRLRELSAPGYYNSSIAAAMLPFIPFFTSQVAQFYYDRGSAASPSAEQPPPTGSNETIFDQDRPLLNPNRPGNAGGSCAIVLSDCAIFP